MKLIEAVKDGNIIQTQLLLKAGANPNIQNNYGYTPLHTSKSPKINKLLLEAGANHTIQNRHGDTPLHYSKSRKQTKLLLQAGANPNVQNNYQKNPLQKIHHHILLNFNSPTDFSINKLSIFKLN